MKKNDNTAYGSRKQQVADYNAYVRLSDDDELSLVRG